MPSPKTPSPPAGPNRPTHKETRRSVGYFQLFYSPAHDLSITGRRDFIVENLKCHPRSGVLFDHKDDFWARFAAKVASSEYEAFG